MKKTNFWKTILIFAGVVLLISFGVYVLISFMVDKKGTMEIISNIWVFLNKPLPIIGVTTLMVLIFLWKAVIATKYGKKTINEIKEEKQRLIQEKNRFISEANNELQKCHNEIDVLRKQLTDVCYISTNKKIKDYGKGLLNNGKESSNNNSKEE